MLDISLHSDAADVLSSWGHLKVDYSTNFKHFQLHGSFHKLLRSWRSALAHTFALIKFKGLFERAISRLLYL